MAVEPALPGDDRRAGVAGRPDWHQPRRAHRCARPARRSRSSSRMSAERPVLADVAVEEGVLGACLMRPAALDAVRLVVQPDDFSRPSHGLVLAAAIAVSDQGGTADAVTVSAWLAEHRQLSAAGGRAAVSTLASIAVPTENAAEHARVIAALAERRRRAQQLEQALIAERNGGVT